MSTIKDPCKPGCCKNQFGVCAMSRKCACHRNTDSRQKQIDDWEEQLKKAESRTTKGTIK